MKRQIPRLFLAFTPRPNLSSSFRSVVGLSPYNLAALSTTPTLLAKKSKASTSASKSSSSSKGKGKASDGDEGMSAEDFEKILEKSRGKMAKVLEWAKGVAFEGVERGRGRVSPALLDSIRVSMPDGGGSTSLSSVASVTAKGMTLYVEVYDSDTMKAVESALHKANVPGMSPQKIDNRSIKIPVSRQTDVQRQQILKSLGETIESAKQQLRLARMDGIKALGGKGEDGVDEVQEITDGFVKDLEALLGTAKKEFEKV